MRSFLLLSCAALVLPPLLSAQSPDDLVAPPARIRVATGAAYHDLTLIGQLGRVTADSFTVIPADGPARTVPRWAVTGFRAERQNGVSLRRTVGLAAAGAGLSAALTFLTQLITGHDQNYGASMATSAVIVGASTVVRPGTSWVEIPPTQVSLRRGPVLSGASPAPMPASPDSTARRPGAP